MPQHNCLSIIKHDLSGVAMIWVGGIVITRAQDELFLLQGSMIVVLKQGVVGLAAGSHVFDHQ